MTIERLMKKDFMARFPTRGAKMKRFSDLIMTDRFVYFVSQGRASNCQFRFHIQDEG
jgi:hypothetical protein